MKTVLRSVVGQSPARGGGQVRSAERLTGDDAPARGVTRLETSTELDKRALYEAGSVYIKLVRAAESVSARVHAQLRASGLSFSQFAVLEAVYHLGPLYQKDLAAKILKSPANMTAVIDALEAKGLVVRERDVDDRRFINVHLTKEGRELLDAVLPDHLRRIAQELSVLTAEERQTLGDLCRKVGKGGNETR